jgi:hypothetical protein
MLGKIGDVTEVQSNGSGTVVAPLEFFQHTLSEWGHHKRLLSVMAPLYPSEQIRFCLFSAAERLRSTPDFSSYPSMTSA